MELKMSFIVPSDPLELDGFVGSIYLENSDTGTITEVMVYLDGFNDDNGYAWVRLAMWYDPDEEILSFTDTWSNMDELSSEPMRVWGYSISGKIRKVSRDDTGDIRMLDILVRKE